MDDTQMNRTSDAAATRKRRSSILKSQRPPRTPFSELEFNVATPTDTAKSRRVSFSRRTGVAEFATNEATTTWKNVYEEHNQSLELPATGSGYKHVGHLGRRVYDQQFEEEEADIIGIGSTGPINASSSLNNLDHQIIVLERTEDLKLSGHHSVLNLTEFTNNTKLFEDPAMLRGEVTDHIDINFSNIQPVGCDYLVDELQNDFKKNYRSASQRQNTSEYIEVDLNMTQVVRNDDDMSITDTVQTPKEHDVTTSVKNPDVNLKVVESDDLDDLQEFYQKFGHKSNTSEIISSLKTNPKIDSNSDVDKINIDVNPYAPLRETDNFAVNEEVEKVLVFDGKRLTLQSDIAPVCEALPNPINNAQSKTILRNLHDDLPNFVDDSDAHTTGLMDVTRLKKNLVLKDMSEEDINKRTFIYDNEDGNISITQVVAPSKVYEDKSKTILYDDDKGNISITQALPTMIAEKRRTIVYDDDEGDMSITRALPSNVLTDNVENDKRKTIVFNDGNMSMTQAIPSNIIAVEPQKHYIFVEDKQDTNESSNDAKTDKRRTIVYEDDSCNISVTQAIPSNIIITAENSSDRLRTVVFESDTGNISVTQVLPTNIHESDGRKASVEAKISESQNGNVRRRTIVYENDTGDLSITQSVPNHVIIPNQFQGSIQSLATVDEGKDGVTKTNNDNNKRKTILFDNNDSDISMTQAVSLNQILCALRDEKENQPTDNAVEYQNQSRNNAVEYQPKHDVDKRSFRTLVFDNDDDDISMTQAIPTNVIECFNFTINEVTKKAMNSRSNKRRTVVFDNDEGDLSVTQVVNTKPIVEQNVQDDLEEALNEALHNKRGNSHRTIFYEKEGDNVSEQLHSEELENEINALSQSIQESVKAEVKRNTVFENDFSLSDDQPVNIQINDGTKQSKEQDTTVLDISMTDIRNAENNDNADIEQRLPASSRSEIERVIKKTLSPEVQSMSSRTILPPLIKMQDEIERSIKNDMSLIISESTYEAVVYQTTLSQLTDQGDTRSAYTEVTAADNILSSTKADQDSKEQQKVKVSNELNDIQQQNEIESLVTVERKLNDSLNVSQGTEKLSVSTKSILNDLLDMSEDEVDDGCQAVQENEENGNAVVVKKSHGIISNDGSMFVITRDEGDEEAGAQTDAVEEALPMPVSLEAPLQIEYKEDNKKQGKLNLAQEIQHKILKFKDTIVGDKSKNRKSEKISSASKSKNTKTIKETKIKTANDTNELLDMLSDLTDKSMRQQDASEGDNEIQAPVTLKGHKALENKSEAEAEPVPSRHSFVPRIPSVDFSREDLLTNLSIAGAALKTRIELELDKNLDSPEPNSPMQSVRMSHEVVKTLQFDESATEQSFLEKLMTPLKKTAFGETTYMQERKSNVIPQFTTVSDGIKELMDDLVKPNADVLPFDGSIAERPIAKLSTHSTQIQANLVTSSQVELCGLVSESVCDANIGKISSVDIINDAVNRSVTRALKSPIKPQTSESLVSNTDLRTDTVKRSVLITAPPPRMTDFSPSRVLIFDHHNPLNNVLLAPARFQEPHKYNPSMSDEAISERSQSAQISLDERDENEAKNITMQYNVSNIKHCMKQQSGDGTMGNVDMSNSKFSVWSKPASVDQSTEVAPNVNLKNIEINTQIAMKGNQELLAANSSLTLVDCPITQGVFDVEISSGPLSPMKVLYSVDREDVISDVIDSELTLNDEEKRKSKKRYRETHKLNTLLTSLGPGCISVEVTPKPNKKMQRLSRSPHTEKPVEPNDADDTKPEKNVQPEKDRTKNKKADSITVQHLLAEYKVGPIDAVSIHEQIMEAMSNQSKTGTSSLEPGQTASQSEAEESSGLQSSCTSSKNLRDRPAGRCEAPSKRSSKVSKMDWQPDLLGNGNLSDSDSGVNIVAKIHKLPFMGRECEWECSSGDTWSFRLLHGRVRLLVRLEHRLDNAARTRVVADTAVQYVGVEVVPYDSKNTLATLCVGFATDTMRWFVNRGCAHAGDVPKLVRRCAAAARLAARWGRLMNEARHHLAFALTPQGIVSLKVANIPLRCVWEVTTQLQLVAEDSYSAPWVAAGDVRVRRVLSSAPPRDDDPAPALRRLPRDWSHAPRAIWRIFKYLKHLTREEDDLFK